MKFFRYIPVLLIVIICIPIAAAADDMVLVPVEDLAVIVDDPGDIPAPFFIDRYEVTNAEFAAFLRDVAPNTEEPWRTWINGEDPNFKIDVESESFDVMVGFDTFPVVTVTLEGAARYAEWAGKSLPTNAQWDAAAILGDSLTSWLEANSEGSTESPCDPEEPGPVPVGSYSPDDLGLFDMIGNVWEWTTDEYETEYLSFMPTLGLSPAAGPSLSVVRGGGFLLDPGDITEYPAAAASPTSRFGNIGFRCVRETD
ncbi:MAG: SUMF1/EgtB/PvdO family nonheme iron enzyme [Deltaproteobacteria bacterium]|nr:SUMF1/EgtB/PvdO family nonheme iron enzyme [Candidatus Zymogenaceae bacterium]